MSDLLNTFLSMGASIGLGWAVYATTGSVYFALLACWFVANLAGYVEGAASSY